MIKQKSCHGKGSSWLQGTVNLRQEAPDVTGLGVWPTRLWAEVLKAAGAQMSSSPVCVT